jgi:hypothetical protein
LCALNFVVHLVDVNINEARKEVREERFKFRLWAFLYGQGQRPLR